MGWPSFQTSDMWKEAEETGFEGAVWESQPRARGLGLGGHT